MLLRFHFKFVTLIEKLTFSLFKPKDFIVVLELDFNAIFKLGLEDLITTFLAFDGDFLFGHDCSSSPKLCSSLSPVLYVVSLPSPNKHLLIALVASILPSSNYLESIVAISI
jgi:hypothetical protein